VYHGVHVFIAEKAFDTWLSGLQHYESLPYTHILPGHGTPGGPELYERMGHYLVTALDLFIQVGLKARLIATFPDFTGTATLDRQKRFLFSPTLIAGN
jgi:hypothetical protein